MNGTDASRRLRVLGAFAALGATMMLALLAAVLRPPEAPGCGEACGPPPVELPETVGLAAGDPKVHVLLWIDLQSSQSRQIFQHVTRMVAASRRDVPAELRLLHLPATPCLLADRSLACVGARLVECAEVELAGAGVQVAGALLDLHWRTPGERTVEAAAAAVTGLGLDAEALLRCADESTAVAARLRSHAALAARHGLKAAPGGLVVDASDRRRCAGFGAWLTESALRAIVGCLVQRHCEEVA